MPKYVLHYFNSRGRAEVARLLFHYAGVEFEDKRYTQEKWAEIKQNDKLIPFEQMPVLEVDGKPLAQSFAIFRYLANEFGLAGKDNFQKALVDMLADAMLDAMRVYITEVFMEKDAEKKAAAEKRFVKEVLSVHLKQVEQVSKANSAGNGFLIGDSLTWVDFLMLPYADIPNAGDVLKDVPVLEAVLENVKSLPQIQEYLESRPPVPGR